MYVVNSIDGLGRRHGKLENAAKNKTREHTKNILVGEGALFSFWLFLQCWSSSDLGWSLVVG